MGKDLVESLNVRVIGSGLHTVVLAHGFGCTQSLWDYVLPSLVNGGDTAYKVILFDWPGASTTNLHDFDSSLFSKFYHAFAQTLLALLKQLQVNSCTYVGHSMSAMIGCIAAVSQPSLFNKLILVGASPRYLNERDYYGGFEQVDLDELYDAMAADFEGWAARFARLVVGVEDAGDAIERFTVTLSGMRPDVAISMAKVIFESDFRGIVEEVKGKTMEVSVLQTRKDIAVPLVVSDYMKHHLGSEGSVDVLPTDGHLPQFSAPNLFTAALLRRLNNN